MKLTIGYFYPNELNLYGDDGNVQILKYRAQMRNIEIEILNIGIHEEISTEQAKNINLVFMGGGPDSSQKEVYKDLLENKGKFLRAYIEDGGVGLFICGSYQLLGHHYKSADGTVIKGLDIYDLYTESFGNKKPRCIGNVLCELDKDLLFDSVFESVNQVGSTLVGFENHGGRTYLGKNCKPFAKVLMGHGNNSEDKTEGCIYKNSIGSYIHGPILSRNPHLADYLIAKAVCLSELDVLDDKLILAAHTASKTLKQ
jgi:CobQ-like glutamine amidotransferase family enzyme